MECDTPLMRRTAPTVVTTHNHIGGKVQRGQITHTWFMATQVQALMQIAASGFQYHTVFNVGRLLYGLATLQNIANDLFRN